MVNQVDVTYFLIIVSFKKKHKEMNMHNQHDFFINALHTKRKLKIRFYSKEDGGYIERVCAPMDYAPGKNINDKIPRYWVWDFDSDKKKHTLPLRSERIDLMQDIGECFEPGSFVTWRTAWMIERDWGIFS